MRQLHNLFIPYDARLIRSMELPSQSDIQDRLYWPLVRSGNYTTKSGYGYLLQHQQREIYSVTTLETLKFFRQLWGLNIMPKWKFFVWKLWHNCLATSFNLQKRGIMHSNHCKVCLQENEDDQHIFRVCPLALEAWEGNDLQIQPYDHPSMSLAAWLELWIGKFLKEDGYQGLRVPLFIGTLWAIWKTWNDQVFS